MSTTDTIPKERISLANTALYEITMISNVLRDLDPESEGLIAVLPGMMARVQTLSEAVSELLEPGTYEAPPDRNLVEAITCKRPKPADTDATKIANTATEGAA